MPALARYLIPLSAFFRMIPAEDRRTVSLHIWFWFCYYCYEFVVAITITIIAPVNFIKVAVNEGSTPGDTAKCVRITVRLLLAFSL